jgi:hypothetical protein
MRTQNISWTGKPLRLASLDCLAFHQMGGTDASRHAILARANRILAIERSPIGVLRFMILNSFYLLCSGSIFASYGNSVTDCRPVRVGASITKGFVTVLWNSRANHHSFLRSPTEQVSWLHPDGTQFNPGESGLFVARSSVEDTATIVLIPKAFILDADTPGMFHGREV